VKLLQIPAAIFLPVVSVLCVLGSYALGLNIFNLYLMVPIGIAAYILTEMKYPIAPLVIGVILGPMADENLRRALMVSEGSFLPFFERPVSLILIAVIVLTVSSQIPAYKRFRRGLGNWLFRRRIGQAAKPDQGSET